MRKGAIFGALMGVWMGTAATAEPLHPCAALGESAAGAAILRNMGATRDETARMATVWGTAFFNSPEVARALPGEQRRITARRWGAMTTATIAMVYDLPRSQVADVEGLRHDVDRRCRARR